ncbi:MAG: hypothetical protein HRU31_01520 [Rhodobacteraceae bacterium]|nr:hypothetical protein [Paracoccaceae bacterium]
MLRPLALLSCLVWATPALADISDEANACIDRLIAEFGNVGGQVLQDQFAEAGTYVLLQDANGAQYECIVWSGPEIAAFRAIGDCDDASAMQAPVTGGEQRVSFNAGTSGTVITASLAPSTSVQYLLGAAAEQFLTVSVSSWGGALDYRILNPDGSDLLELISSDTPYRGQLWQSGDHVVEIVNGGAQPVSFDVSFGIE